MDSLLPEKPFRGFLDPLLSGVDCQHLIQRKNVNLFRPSEILRKAGWIFFTIIPGTQSFNPGKHPSMNSGYLQGIYCPGLLYEKS
jgi:hypothetical protein